MTTNTNPSAQSHLLEVVTDPQWDGRAPVSVSGDCPVTRILQPISKPLFSYKLWDPATDRAHDGDDDPHQHKPLWHSVDTTSASYEKTALPQVWDLFFFCLFDYS